MAELERTDRRPRVASLAIELTAYCNQTCDYCYNAWRANAPRLEAPGRRSKVLQRVERILGAWRLQRVTLTGGEPLAHPDALNLLEILGEAGVPAQLISNGGLITASLARALAERKVTYVQVTLNGPTPELHAEHVGAGHFQRTLRGVRHLVNAGVPVVGCIVLTRKNHDAVAQILHLWEELGASHIALSRFSPAGYAARHAAQLLPSRSELDVALQQAASFGKTRPQLPIMCTMPMPPCALEASDYAPVQFGTCPIGTSEQELALGHGGELRNCTLHGSALGGVGDILDPDVDLQALLHAPELTGYRRQLPEFCEGCVHAESCGGGCGAAAEWVSGLTRDEQGRPRRLPDPFIWQHVDDELGARFDRERRDGKTHLEVVL